MRKPRRVGRKGLGVLLSAVVSAAAYGGEGMGACCFDDDSCAVRSEIACLESGGLYQGDGTVCNPCPSRVGACCLRDDVCSDGTEFDCIGQGGVFLLGIPCETGLCLGEGGACCSEDGSCAEVSGFACAAEGGAFNGVGSSCSATLCVEIGACCVDIDVCIDGLIPIRCAHLGGTFLGDGTWCDLAACLPIPPIPFQPPKKYVADGEPIIEAIGDFDLDGAPDVIVVIPREAPELGLVQVFLNQGNDETGEWMGLVAGPAVVVGLEPTGVAVGLIDEDLFPDVVISNGGDDTVSLLINAATGDGTFEAPVTIAVDELDVPTAIATGDFTGNGRIDLVVASGGNDTIVLLENVAGPPFQGGAGFVVREVVDVGDLPISVCPEDLDNDKDLDLLVAEAGAGKVGALIHGDLSPAGEGPIFDPVIELPAGDRPMDLASADLDGNGFPDIIVANFDSGNVSLNLNNGDGTFDNTFPPIRTGDQPRSVDVGDLDGDGDIDLAVAASDQVIGPAVQVLENFLQDRDTLSFARPFGYDVGAAPNFVVVVELNDDDALDLVTVNADDEFASGGTVTALLGEKCLGDLNGDGSVGFADLLALLSAWGPCAGCPEDLNRDGGVDQIDLKILLALWGDCG